MVPGTLSQSGRPCPLAWIILINSIRWRIFVFRSRCWLGYVFRRSSLQRSWGSAPFLTSLSLLLLTPTSSLSSLLFPHFECVSPVQHFLCSLCSPASVTFPTSPTLPVCSASVTSLPFPSSLPSPRSTPL